MEPPVVVKYFKIANVSLNAILIEFLDALLPRDAIRALLLYPRLEVQKQNKLFILSIESGFKVLSEASKFFISKFNSKY